MIARLVVAAWFMASAAALAAGEPFGVLDIELGASYARLERALDFRDINTALARVEAGKPDLGKRGYGCQKRDDPFAEVGCVSHQEKLNGIETREIRLHFLQGRLQQFSVTAELQHYEAVTGYLRTRYGQPQIVSPLQAADAANLKWQGESGHVTAYRGKDLVFVNFELVSYPDAVRRKREGAVLECS